MFGDSQAVSIRPSGTWPLGVVPHACMVGTCMPVISVPSVLSMLTLAQRKPGLGEDSIYTCCTFNWLGHQSLLFLFLLP